MDARFHADLDAPTSRLPHFWETVVGSGHATLGLRADWQAQLLRCHDELGFRYVRFHGILSDDMGTLINQNEQLLYSFHNADKIIDFLLGAGLKPFVELSFMPLALSSGGDIVFHYKANVTPPRDFDEWATLISKLVQHWVDRYGQDEVSSWFFEVWNEPNLDAFWKGTQDQYFHLYKVTARAIKAVSPALKVGGPATAANAWIDDFRAFCKVDDVPCDFISTHHYPTDAFGSPGDDTEAQLSKSYLGVLRDQVREVRGKVPDLPLYYTEWCTSSNPRDTLHDDPYAAAYIVHTILSMGDLVQGYSYWAFSDIFEENYFPSLPFQGGFGLTTIHGIAKPAYRGFEILHVLGDTLHPVTGEHPTVSAWLVSGPRRAMLVLVNLALPRHDIAPASLRVDLANAPDYATARIARIDADHANAKALWQHQGSPEYPTDNQVDQMIAASRLNWTAHPVSRDGDTVRLHVEVAPQSVTAIQLDHPAGR